jgi:hypothetical protein
VVDVPVLVLRRLDDACKELVVRAAAWRRLFQSSM